MVEEKLDRAKVNSSWLQMYLKVILINIVSSHSNHSPILVKSAPTSHQKATITFVLKTVSYMSHNWNQLSLMVRALRYKWTLVVEFLIVPRSYKVGVEGKE